MANSPFAAHFEVELRKWEHDLNLIVETIGILTRK
jgi:hypothetical protein